MDRKSSLNVDLLFQRESHHFGDFWFDRRVQGLIFKIQCTFFPWRSQRNHESWDEFCTDTGKSISLMLRTKHPKKVNLSVWLSSLF